MRQIIAFTGTHSTGKSTAALKLGAEIRKSNPEHSLMVAVDIERDVIRQYPEVELDTPRMQNLVFYAFLEFLRGTENFKGWHVHDRTIYDVLAYSRAYGISTELFESTIRDLRKSKPHYFPNRIIFNRAADFPLINDGVRNTDPVFRLKVEQELLKLYEELGIQFEWGANE